MIIASRLAMGDGQVKGFGSSPHFRIRNPGCRGLGSHFSTWMPVSMHRQVRYFLCDCARICEFVWAVCAIFVPDKISAVRRAVPSDPSEHFYVPSPKNEIDSDMVQRRLLIVAALVALPAACAYSAKPFVRAGGHRSLTRQSPAAVAVAPRRTEPHMVLSFPLATIVAANRGLVGTLASGPRHP